MGTRHYQVVIDKNGKSKIKQYGQWDGYPNGQGLDILKYLKSGDLIKYQENLSKIPLITKEQIEMVNADVNWPKNYPYLSRDCGSDIHQMIEDGTVPFVRHTGKTEANKWCEGFYTIDFKKNKFISKYYDKTVVYALDALPTEEEYLNAFKSTEEE